MPYTVTQQYLHSFVYIICQLQKGNKSQNLRIRHSNIKVTFNVYHERRYVIAETHSEGIPKLRPVLAVREVTSWVVKEMVNSVFSYLWGNNTA